MKIRFNRNYNRGDLTFNLYKINKNIAKQKRKVSCFAVVPFAGTWIEIFNNNVEQRFSLGRSLRGNVD